MSEHTSDDSAGIAKFADRRKSTAADPHGSATRTRNALQNALMTLAAIKPLRYITVSELVDAAGVHRTTFYEHYADIYDIAAELGNSAVNGVVVAAGSGAEHVPLALAHILEHRSFYRLVFGPLDVGFSRTLRANTEAIINYRAHNDVLDAFLSGGVIAVLGEWTNSESNDIGRYAHAISELTRANTPG